ncbi:hypothetical protein GRAN_3344 [Granulicella sibirica]|uniref:Uncharacterized protein n=1 Tax=Granulicella sibirica TaxID=2479048 RepID=A0A4Q0SZZ4_9BACT|nr:hypothetical protein GRAN_3344 [Granulicella sibirica]
MAGTYRFVANLHSAHGDSEGSLVGDDADPGVRNEQVDCFRIFQARPSYLRRLNMLRTGICMVLEAR